MTTTSVSTRLSTSVRLSSLSSLAADARIPVRNPLDSIASWWHLSNSPKTPEGFQDHEAKVDIGKFGAQQRAELLDLAERWTRHAIYWQQAPVLTHTLRYVLLRVVLKKPG